MRNRLFRQALFVQSSSRFSFVPLLPLPKRKIGHNKDEQWYYKGKQLLEPLLFIYFSIYLLVLGFRRLIFVSVLLIHLGVGPLS